MIRSEEPGQPFAGPGDSGALIWDGNGTPIALVSFADGEDDDDENSAEGGTIEQAEGDDERYTYAVRLDHCLRALRDKTGVAIVKCEAIGSPIVPVDPRPEPTLELRGNDSIEGLGAMGPLEGAMAPAYLAAPAGPNQIVAMQPTPDPTHAAPAYEPQGAAALEPNTASVDALVAQYRNRSLSSSSSDDPETQFQTNSEEPEGMPRSLHGNT